MQPEVRYPMAMFSVTKHLEVSNRAQRPTIKRRPITCVVLTLGFSQSLLQIGNDILDILDTDTQTDHVGSYTGGFQFLTGQLTVRCRGRVRCQ